MESKGQRDRPGVIAFPPFIWLGFAVVSTAVHFIFPMPMMSRSLGLLLGITSLLAGPCLAISALLVMRKAGTNIDPAKPALTIVRNGPFRFTRNPMYLSLCLLQVGLGCLLNDWAPLIFVLPLALVLHYGVILREERYLEGKFGSEYLALKQSVRRWL